MIYQVLFVVYGILMLVFAGVLALAVRQIGILSLRIGPSGSRTTGDGPKVGSEQARSRFLQELIAAHPRIQGKNVLVAFVSPYCSGCRILLPVLKTVAVEERKGFAVVAVSRSLEWREAADLDKLLGRKVVVVEDEKLFDEWNVVGTPYCVVLGDSGRVVAKGIANAPEHVESLLTALDMGVPTFEDYIERSVGLEPSPEADVPVETGR